jgi:hypothetical protein
VKGVAIKRAKVMLVNDFKWMSRRIKLLLRPMNLGVEGSPQERTFYISSIRPNRRYGCAPKQESHKP